MKEDNQRKKKQEWWSKIFVKISKTLIEIQRFWSKSLRCCFLKDFGWNIKISKCRRKNFCQNHEYFGRTFKPFGKNFKDFGRYVQNICQSLWNVGRLLKDFVRNLQDFGHNLKDFGRNLIISQTFLSKPQASRSK